MYASASTPSSSSCSAPRRSASAASRSTIAFPSPLTPSSSLRIARRAAPAPGAQLAQRRQDVALAVDLEPDGMRDALLLEHAPAARLRPEPRERRDRRRRSAARARPPADLVLGDAERQDDRHLGVADQAADPADRARPREQLARQRLVAPVDERDGVEPAARLRRVQLGDEAEVVVEHPRVDRLRRHVDHARPRRRAAGSARGRGTAPRTPGSTGIQLLRHVEADRVDDDHRPLDVADRAQRDVRPERAQPAPGARRRSRQSRLGDADERLAAVLAVQHPDERGRRVLEARPSRARASGSCPSATQLRQPRRPPPRSGARSR